MSMSERRRLAMFSQVSLGQISVSKAGRLLGLSERQARRCWKRYRELGDAGLVHGLRGRRSNASKVAWREQVLARYQRHCGGTGAAYAARRLVRKAGLKVPRSTLWYWLRQEHLVVKGRRVKKHRARRARRGCVGELIQMDGSTHVWLVGGELCVLFALVDDATNRLLCRFYATEDTSTAFDVFGRYVKLYGLPQALYVDRDSIYRVNDPLAREAGRLSGQMPLTQFGRAMKQLAVGMIYAKSPQAKGRVERIHGILQDVLVKELRLEGIATMAEANRYLEATFLREFNADFGKPPAEGANLHRGVGRGLKLEDVLCVIEERVVSEDWCVRYGGQVMQIEGQHAGRQLAGRRVQVLAGRGVRLRLRYRGESLSWRAFGGRGASCPLRAPCAGGGAPVAQATVPPPPAPGQRRHKSKGVKCQAQASASCGRSGNAWRPGLGHPWRGAYKGAAPAATRAPG